MRLGILLISFLACSCASKKPLEIPVGFVMADKITIKWTHQSGSNYETLLEDCGQCVLMEPQDFGLLLDRCKRERR